jgi:hypothetical protein
MEGEAIAVSDPAGRRDGAMRIRRLSGGSEHPAGQWNTVEIETQERSVLVWLNGTLVNEGFSSTVDRGWIALRADGAEIEIRRFEIQPISASLPAPPTVPRTDPSR